MKKSLFPTFACIVFVSLNIFSQNTIPTPTPAPAEDHDVVKISTSLIQIDVTVTDKKGNIVKDISPDEIEIYENGVKQNVTNFSFVSNVRERSEGKAEKSAGPNLPPSAVRPENVRRTIALVVDDLTLSFASTYWVRQALKKFVDQQMQEGDLVAIIRTGAGIGALQQFTNDKRQLYAAIEKVRWNAQGAGRIGSFAALEAAPLGGPPPAVGDEGEGIDPEAAEKDLNEFRQSIFATGTLGAINYVVRGMQDLPGRKSVMLLSDGFKLFTSERGGFRDSSRVLDSLRRLVDQANRASVVIYTMDARGLEVGGLTAEDNTDGRSLEQISRAMDDRRAELRDTQDGLIYLARQTGGIAIINNNDLSYGIRKILDDQSYYLIGYTPDEETFDPKTRRFNKLAVKVTRPGTRVRYRSGFFGISDEKLARPNLTAGQRLMTALTSPFAMNEVSLRLNALFGSTPKHGPYIRSLLHIKAQDLSFTTEPDGTRKAVFDILAISFGDNGTVVDQAAKTYTMTLSKDKFEQLTRRGFVYDFTFPIKKPGAYQLRVALRDHVTNKVGSANQFIEVPNLKKGRLTFSGVALENVSFDEWNRRNSAQSSAASGSNALTDTSLRQFKRGTILNYGFTIFNAKSGGAMPANLTSQIRLFRDGKPIFEGKPQPVAKGASTDPKATDFNASLSLGSAMAAGDYVLEIVITDNNAKGKRKTAVQYVQFEVVE